jgi:hypothetical protein
MHASTCCTYRSWGAESYAVPTDHVPSGSHNRATFTRRRLWGTPRQAAMYVCSNEHTYRALQESIYRRRMFTCPDPLCREPIIDTQAKRRRECGYTSINCPVCGTEISLLDREELLAAVRPSIGHKMDRAADSEREHETAVSILQGKVVTGDFDVFLCHNSADKPQVREIGEWLKNVGYYLGWMNGN